MDTVTVLSHPLVRHKLTLLRDKETSSRTFRALVGELTAFMIYEATARVELEATTIHTPLQETRGWKMRQVPFLIPILRAGAGMLEASLECLPHARVGFIGLYRDHQAHPVEYYSKLPQLGSEDIIFVLDPMLATGRSAAQAIGLIKRAGGSQITLLSLVSAPEGIDELLRQHPDVAIYTTAVDEKLDANNYILPGLGDAGDRLYKSK